MTKKQFMGQMHVYVEMFSVYIDATNKKYPKAKVENVSEPDWFEQFILYMGMKDET